MWQHRQQRHERQRCLICSMCMLHGQLDSMLQCGTVTHALCAAIREVLQKYEELLVQLEHQMSTTPFFTLQKMWLFVHPILHQLSLLYGLTSDISAISHADVLESDSEDEESDADSDAGDDALNGARAEMEKERRDLLHVANGEEADAQADVEGGIAKGGEILSMLWDRVDKQSGDPRAYALFLELFHKSAQPYARTLLAC